MYHVIVTTAEETVTAAITYSRQEADELKARLLETAFEDTDIQIIAY